MITKLKYEIFFRLHKIVNPKERAFVLNLSLKYGCL